MPRRACSRGRSRACHASVWSIATKGGIAARFPARGTTRRHPGGGAPGVDENLRMLSTDSLDLLQIYDLIEEYPKDDEDFQPYVTEDEVLGPDDEEDR